MNIHSSYRGDTSGDGNQDATWIETLVRPAIRVMAPYVSARSLVASEGGQAPRTPIFLDANELGDAYLGEVDPASRVHRYPEPQPPALVEALSKLYQVPVSHLCVGAGADAAIDAVIRIFCEANQDGIVITPPTYGYYKVAAAIQGAHCFEAPLLGATWELDEPGMLRAVDQGAKLVFICSPNNPTGHVFPRDQILQMVKRLEGRALLVVDEAYIEFTEAPSMARDVSSHPGLLVLRTLSKAWGLAGLRIGTAIGHPQVIGFFHKVRFPYPLSRLSHHFAEKVLGEDPREQIKHRVAIVLKERERLASGLSMSPFVERVDPSHGNFLLVRCRDRRAFLKAALNAGVIVRDRHHEPGLEGAVRVTVGSPSENNILMAAVQTRCSPL